MRSQALGKYDSNICGLNNVSWEGGGRRYEGNETGGRHIREEAIEIFQARDNEAYHRAEIAGREGTGLKKPGAKTGRMIVDSELHLKFA